MKMVEIIVLKFKDPEVEVECAKRIIENTEWPFKLVFYDNRKNTASTAKIWNKLIEDATCDYVMLIDSDAYVPKLEPCWLTRMMESFKHKDCDVVIPVANNVGGAMQKVSNGEKYPSECKNNNVWSGFCYLIKKDTMKKAGPFDEQFYFYGQDSEWAYRIAKKGLNTYMRKDVFINHHAGYSGKKADKEGTFDREADKTMARLLFVKKTHG
jgi:cellulose synthase/poly-beta-1,6-N-acetylglucosamine synthase-like glycosyltransferase